MKTLTKSLIAAGVAAGIGGLALIPSTFAHGEDRGFGPRFGEHRPFGMMHRGMRLFELFDANKDGIVTQDEIDKVRSDRLKRFDTNGDGKLSLKEYEALWLDAMHERMVDRFQRLDRDGDAAVTLEEFVAPTKHLVMWIDTDDDGKVTMKELIRMRHFRDRDGHDDWHHHPGSDRDDSR